MSLRVPGVLCVVLVFCGCSNIPAHRASQHREGFSQWDAPTQQRLLAEKVQVGDTREMVYVALGTPIKPPVWTDDQPPLERWEYLAYETEPPAPAESSAASDILRAQTVNNVVVASPVASPKLVTADFDAAGKLVRWKVYTDAQRRSLPAGFREIQMPAPPKPAPAP